MGTNLISLRASRWALSAFVGGGLIFACGARTDLRTSDAPPESTLFDGGPLDVQVDCPSPAYCDPGDPGNIYQCGVAVYRCGSLEQCEERAGAAQCINPCLDSLGNDTSNGCDFYAVEMDTTDSDNGSCFAVFVVNQWRTGEPAKIEVTRGSQVLPVAEFARVPVGKGTSISYGPYDPRLGLAKDQIAILFLSRDPGADSEPNISSPRLLAGCPAGVGPAVAGDAALHGTGKGTAFRIRTNVPVVAYQMLPYGGGRARITGATLLLPTNTWDTNYVIADAYAAPLASKTAEERAGPTTVVIASQDGTDVTINPTSDILAGGGLAGTLAGVPATYSLHQGEYLQFTQRAELTGSALQASKPVVVIGGSTFMDLPLDVARADRAEQMLPPVRALGSEYVAVRYRSRTGLEESVPWRIVGVVDGTQLIYEPAAPAGAPMTLAARQWVEFSDPGPFTVRSQDSAHPFYVAGYMTGGQPHDGNGDPEFVNIVSSAQYLSKYTFFTDPTYPETNLVIVRVRDTESGEWPDVTLDCAGVLGGWQPVGTSETYEMVRVDLSTGNFEGVGGCDNGVHTIEASFAHTPSDTVTATPRIGVTIWGWGNGTTWPDDYSLEDEANPKFTRWVSYAYPAGANVRSLNDAVLRAK